jgi:hypothetical protein
MSWSWWCTPEISKVKRMRQEDHEFKTSLEYTLARCGGSNL